MNPLYTSPKELNAFKSRNRFSALLPTTYKDFFLKANINLNNINTNFKPSNRISFSERNRIRNVPLTKSKLDSNYSENYLNQYNSESNYFKRESSPINDYYKLIEKDEEILNKNDLSKKKKNKAKNKIKYKLKDLMIMNPYHYVPKRVVFSKILVNNLINSRFNKTKEISLGKERSKSESTFLKTSYNKGKKRKVIESQTLSFNDKHFSSDELIWRLIGRIMMTKGFSSFKQAVRYEAITKVWKVHSLIIERLLVNYNNFKWFFEKGKTMNEKVLLEFLSLLKLNNNKGYEDFCKKIILIFDEEGQGDIKTKEFFFLLNISSQISLNYEKMNFLVNLFEDYNRINKKKSVNIEEIPNNFRVILNHESYRKDLKRLFENLKNEFFKGKKFNSNPELNYVEKDRVLKFLLENESVKIILKKFYRDYSKAHILYNDEIMNEFYATMRNSKRMLNIHDMVELCNAEYLRLEKNLMAIENKMNIENQINEFENYIKEEKEYYKYH